MKKFFGKSYVYAVIFSVLLVSFFTFSLLKIYIIPVKLDFDADSAETVDENRFSFATAADQTLEEETTYGTGHIGSEGDESETPAATDEYTTAEETTAATDYPIISDNYYEDENIRVQIKTARVQNTTCYVADIKVNSVEYLKTALARNTYGLNIVETVGTQAKREGAIIAINGDYYGANEQGYVIRNGCVYRDTRRRATNRQNEYNDLAIYMDGRFEVFSERDVKATELINNGVYHAFAFGPELVTDGAVAVGEHEEVKVASGIGNPRTAIGIIEPLHYIFVVSDGRTSESHGLSLYKLADYMRRLGCQVAYNLDGGGSSTLWFNGKVLNKPTTDGKIITERAVSDIVYIGY